MNRFFSLVMALTMCVALTTPAWAAPDQYVNDAQGRQYLVPSEGQYQGQRMMELTTPSSNGTFGFTSAGSSSYHLNVSGGTDANYQNIQIWTDRHNFEIISAGGGWFRIKFATRYIDTNVTGGVKEGSNLWLYAYSTGDSEKDQTFKFKKNSDGTYTICSRHNEDLVFDVENGTMANGTNVRLWTSNGSAAQKWILTPTSGTYMLPDITPQTTVPDKYFVRYLIANGFASIYNHSSHTVTGKATLSANYDSNTGKAKAGANEHVVIVNPEAVAEFNKLGTHGNISYKDQSTLTKQFEGVSNFKGIEYFTNLKKLDLSRAQFGDSIGTSSKVAGYHGNYTKITPANLNLQYNTQLEYLNLDYAEFKTGALLSSSHIYDLEKLTFLNLSNNFLTDIDLDQFPVLERFQACHNFDLRTIKANIENRNMKELAIFDSMFGWKDGDEDNGALQALIDKFPRLVFLHAFATPNYELDLTGHEYLESIWLLKSAYGASQGLVYDGVYNIVSYKDHALGFDCEGGSSEKNTNVQLWTINRNATHHQFKIQQVSIDGNGVRWYSIKPNHNTGMAVDVSDASTTNGANIQLWTYNGNAAQLFAFVRNDDGSYKIVSKLNGTSVLDINGGNVAQGTNIQLWEDNGSAAQKWVLLPIDLTITAGQAGSARQIAKGPWLHKLDLSKCEELRDVNVQNMHLASLNLNSPHIKKPLSEEYQDWTFCREVTNASGVYGAGQLVPDVIVKNNYRHVNVNTFKHKDEKTGKWCWMFYLRLSYNGNDAKEASLVLNKQSSYFETMTLDTYSDYNALGSMSRKEFKIENTLEEDSLNCDRISHFYTAKEIDNINSTGLMTHDLSVANDHTMCTIEHDGVNPPIVNNGEVQDAATSEFLEHFSKKVYGKILLLKAGVSDNEPTTVPDNVPKAVYYAYDMNTRHHTQKYAPARKGVSAKEEGEQAVMGGFYFDLHYPLTFQDEGIVTAIEEVNVENKEVASVKYYNLAGIENDNPFMGVNIMVVTYTDGTKSTAKVLK